MIRLDRRHSYEDIFREMKELAGEYEDFTVCRAAGESHDGRAIPVFRVGMGRKTLVLTGGISGREWANPVLLLKLLEEYCRLYQEDGCVGEYRVRGLLDHCALAVLPLVNPDGYQVAREGYSQIRNPVLRQLCRIKGIPCEQWEWNARGVNIGGNFPCRSYISQQLGEYPGSEQETQTLIRVFQEYDTLGYMDFHSRGRVICYYRHAMSFSYNQRNHRMARYLQKISGYGLGRRGEEDGGGSPVDYYSELVGQPALTVETLAEDGPEGEDRESLEKAFREICSLPLEFLSRSGVLPLAER